MVAERPHLRTGVCAMTGAGITAVLTDLNVTTEGKATNIVFNFAK